jgi:alcohol dehydrogenase class IV
MRYNMESSAERYALVAEAMGVRAPGMSFEDAARAAVRAVQELTGRLGLPVRLREAGVPRGALGECAEQSLSDGSIVYNPRQGDAEELRKLLEEAW